MTGSSEQPVMHPDLRLSRLGPHAAAILAMVVLAGLGWVYLGLLTAAAADGGLGRVGRALLDTLCRPRFGAPDASFASYAFELVLIAAMWSAMVLAMMLPTASGMVLAYADIAAAAAARRERVVSPLVLISGYLAAWLAFAVAATALQWLLTRLALLDSGLGAAGGVFSGAILIGAGAYQFSNLKHACLTLCQRPFPYLFANWSTAPAAVFRLGANQGVYCVGCCWAMMLVMFAVGVMNVVWMAGLGVVMAVEKLGRTARLSQAVGAILIAAGVVVLASPILAHWPTG